MADIKSPEERSRNMSLIRSRDTKPEEYIRRLLFNRGYRYRKNVSGITGHPDVWLARYNTAIFVNGCYWHRHKGCKYAYTPKSREEFWTAKFERNIQRDNEVRQILSDQGIRLLIIWECTIKSMIKSQTCEEQSLSQIESFLSSKELFFEL